jgi:hypothetical protein
MMGILSEERTSDFEEMIETIKEKTKTKKVALSRAGILWLAMCSHTS